MKKKKKKKNLYKLKVKEKVRAKPIENFKCITCEEEIQNINQQVYMGDQTYRHVSCGPGSRAWSMKFPSWENFALYLDSVGARDYFIQYLKERGYTEDKFFRIKNAPKNFLIHLKKHLKTSITKRGSSMVKANKKTRMSKSGKFKNLRHLIETVFAKNKGAEKKDIDKIVKVEYPGSAFLKVGPQNTHFNWYRAHIVGKGEFTQVPAPSWAKDIDKSPKKKKDKKDKIVEKVKTLTKKFKKEDKLKKKKTSIIDTEEEEDADRAKKAGLPSKLKLKKKNPLLKVGPTNEELEEIENGGVEGND
jgi:hypothetical protein